VFIGIPLSICGGVTVVPLGWDTVNVHPEASISSDKLEVIFTGSNSSRSVRANKPFTSSQSIELDLLGEEADAVWIGLFAAAADMTTATQSTSGFYGIRRSDGDVIENGVLTGNNLYPYAFNATLTIEVQSSTGKTFMGANGTYFNTGDPAAGTGEVFTLPAGTYHPACVFFKSGHTLKIQKGATREYALPFGYTEL